MFIWPDAVAWYSTYYSMAATSLSFVLPLCSSFFLPFLHYVHTSLSRWPLCNRKVRTRDVFIFRCCVAAGHCHFPGHTAVRCAILWCKSAISAYCEKKTNATQQACLKNASDGIPSCSAGVHCLCTNTNYINTLACCLGTNCQPADQQSWHHSRTETCWFKCWLSCRGFSIQSASLQELKCNHSRFYRLLPSYVEHKQCIYRPCFE